MTINRLPFISTHNTPSHLRSAADQIQSSQQSLQQYQYASLPMTAHYDLHAIRQDAIIVTPEIEPIPVENAALMAIASNDGMLAECNYKNCNIMAFQTPQPVRMRRSTDRHASRDQLDAVDGSSAILPPPLFDEKANDPNGASGVSGGGPSDNSTAYIRSRRHHRTIPRHFTTVEPLITTATVEPSPSIASVACEQQQPQQSMKTTAANANNKKPTCQCPIQHVPMTYMGANHLNSTRNESSELFLSTLNRKHSSKSIVAKSTSFPNESTDSAQLVVSRMFPRDTASGLINDTASANYQPSAASSSRQQSTLRRQKTPVKISTISKQIGNAEGFVVPQAHHEGVRRKHTQSAATLSLMADPMKASDITAKDIKPLSVNIISKNEIVSSTFPIQLIESIGKNHTAAVMPKHPMLPPKMSKMSVHQQQQQQQAQPQQPITNHIYASAARIPTISKATVDNHFMAATATSSSHRASLPKSHPHGNYSGRHQNHHPDVPPRGDRSKSLPRNDDRIPGHEPSPSLDKSISSGKLNFTASNFPMLVNHYTLPKSSSSKSSLNSTITDVVNKVPAVVNISGAFTNVSAMPSSKGHSSNASKSHDGGSHSAQPQQKHHRKSVVNAAAVAATVAKYEDKSLPVCTTYKNCSNPKEHFLPNDTSLDDDYLSECENCKSAHGSRYYLDEPIEEQPQETMTLQRKMDDKEEEQQMYYRTSSTLPTNTKQKTT